MHLAGTWTGSKSFIFSDFRLTDVGCPIKRENLAGDAKGKGRSGANRKAESTDDGHARLGFCRLRASARNVQQHWNNPVRVNISRPCAKTNAAGARIDISSTFGHYRGRNWIFAYRALA